VLSDNWYGFVAPAGTPPEILKRLNAAAVAALRNPETIKQFEVQGTLAAPGTPGEFEAALRDEKAKWEPIVKANHIRLE
jgi:tripartite-type tricarboxylate transporter receptor subunit TctC